MSDKEVEIRQITLTQTYPIRRAVLYPDSPQTKIYIPNDQEGTHFGAWLQRYGDAGTSSALPGVLEETLIATISVFREPLPLHLAQLHSSWNPARSLRFRKFACLGGYQGRGIGTKVLEHVFEFARRDLGLGTGSIVWCDARLSSQDWYLRRGMKIIGEVFCKGDIEYIVMAIQV